MRILGALIVVLIVGSAAGLGHPQADAQQQPAGYLYQWVDDRGNVHITDNPAEVPEKYRSGARTMQENSPQQEPPPTSEPQAAPRRPAKNSGVQNDTAENDKAQWQQRIKGWKNQLADAESRYRSLQQQRNELIAPWGSPALAPLAARQQADQIDQQMQGVQQEIEKAKDMIENVIPEEARKAGVPPGWLRE